MFLYHQCSLNIVASIYYAIFNIRSNYEQCGIITASSFIKHYRGIHFPREDTPTKCKT